MLKAAFANIDAWVFDLDNTLYPPQVRLFDQIKERMTTYVSRVLNVSTAEANQLRAEYWRDHGTTLAGLMREHGIDPDPYLVEVHDISFDALSPDPVLADGLRALPGRRVVYTNGSAPYARNVLAARGLSGIFDAVYGVEHADYHPKPDAAAFAKVFERDGLMPTKAAMFEDDARNLRVPHTLGMRTIHVAPDAIPASHIHFHTDDLSAFLKDLTAP